MICTRQKSGDAVGLAHALHVQAPGEHAPIQAGKLQRGIHDPALESKALPDLCPEFKVGPQADVERRTPDHPLARVTGHRFESGVDVNQASVVRAEQGNDAFRRRKCL